METIKQKVVNALKWFWAWEYKEEVLTVLGFLALFLYVNVKLTGLNPEAGYFNLPSQADSVLYALVKFVVCIVLIWVGIRVIGVHLYRFLRNDILKNFDTLSIDLKWNVLKLFLTLLALLAATAFLRAETPDLTAKRTALVKLVYSQVGIHEITNNSSPEIDMFLAHVGMPPRNPWCVAWVSYDLSKVGVANPMSAYSPDYARKKDIIWTPKNQKIQPLPGDVPTFYYASLGRVGHGCFYLETDKSGWFKTGEGNANQKLSRTGGEVCILKRDPMKIYAISRFIK